jgi:hypothetical protein
MLFSQTVILAVVVQGDLLAAKCHPVSGASPWPRYANPEDARWTKMETPL